MKRKERFIKSIFDKIKALLIRIFTSRLFALGSAFSVLFFVLIARLFLLQIIEGEKYLKEFQQKSLKEISTLGTRGNIYDRDGKLLAYNEKEYNIIISDTDGYDRSHKGINERNYMLYSLAKIIEKYGYRVDGQYKISMNEDGKFTFEVSGDKEMKRFISNLRGKDMKDLDDEDYDITAEEAFDISINRYGFGDIKDKKGRKVDIDDETLLDMINIIYTMRLTAFQKYQDTTIVRNVSEECMAEILESKAELKGVDISTVSVRRYNYAPYLSHIIGYTGQIRPEQLDEMNKNGESYELNDTIGVWGLEKSEEAVLKGEKGRRLMYLNSVGSILEIVKETPSKAGNDIYTTISADDQMAIYYLIEQELAGILATKIIELDDVNAAGTDATSLRIPAKDAYFQLINNNVLDTEHFTDDNAKYAERAIASIISKYKDREISLIKSELEREDAGTLKDIPQDMQAYMVYIYDYLCKNSINQDSPTFKNSEAYKKWLDDDINLHEFIMDGIDEGWIDISGLDLSQEYSNKDTIFRLFLDEIINYLKEDIEFRKLLYKYAISDKSISPNILMMSLIEQNVITDKDGEYEKLSQGNSHYAYEFFIRSILRLDLTPAQLALDPCNGAVTVVDVKTGKVRALVSYPGFDNNRISDRKYLDKCNKDLSLPLLNCATQTQLAPGSTFKPITAVAALEEKVIDENTIINATGKYEEVSPPIKCWIWPSRHGEENIVAAIKNSCNFFFSDLGHRLSMNEEGEYEPRLGLARIKKYATMFGLSKPSGVEIDEASPKISDKDPERSAMGQGTHAYNNAQLARYITAVANDGIVFDLSIIDKITDSDGNLIKKEAPRVSDKMKIADKTWSLVHQGLREVITEGVAEKVFRNQDIAVAGKTGTAQERKDRANHAVFVSYAPFENPEISVTVNLPNAYSSGNAAVLANSVYNYWYGKDSLENIIARDASQVRLVNVSD